MAGTDLRAVRRALSDGRISLKASEAYEDSAIRASLASSIIIRRWAKVSGVQALACGGDSRAIKLGIFETAKEAKFAKFSDPER
jgi:hypothetical protein